MDVLRETEKAIESIERRHLFHRGSFTSSSYNLFFTEMGALKISSGEVSAVTSVMGLCRREEITLEAEGSSEYLLLRLRPESVLSLTGCEGLLRGTVTSLPARAKLITEESLHMIEKLDGDMRREAALTRSSHLLQILSLLTESCSKDDVFPEPLTYLTERRMVLYRSLLQYIRMHAAESPTLKAAAEEFHVTSKYLGSFLRETLGMTFREAVEKAVEDREELLRLSANEAAPHGEEAPGALIGGGPGETAAKAADEFLHLETRIDPIHAMPQFFRKLINLGYAANLRNLDLGASLDLMQSKVGFTCGRICRITDLITQGSIRGKSYYNFSAVFSLLDSLMTRGITPFLELGNKSFQIQETTTVSFAPVSPTDTRKYYQQLLRILPEFVRACINHYGQAAFDGWYFEISFMYTSDEERDQFGLVQYARMFRRIYTVLREFSPSCRIGGPGFNDWSDPAKIRQMIRLMSSHGIVPDFFSAYIYPMTADASGNMHLSSDPDEGIRRMQIFADTVRGEHPEKEVWITEFNSNLASRNYLNDASYQAAYIVRMMLGALPLKIAATGYYLLSDAPLRYLDSLEFLFGGWGLITDRGLPKPSFHACRMMALLGHYQIRLTKESLITANSRGSFQILLFRYQHPKETFLYRNVEKEDLSLPTAVFDEIGVTRCRIEIGNVLKGTYLVKEYRIDGVHSDLYTAWRELDFLYPPNAATLEEMRMRSSLIPRTRVYRIEEGQPFSMHAEMRGTEVRLITVDLYTSHT